MGTPWDKYQSTIASVTAAALKQDGSKSAKVTVGMSAVTVPLPSSFVPTSVLIYNSHASAVVLAEPNQAPTQAGADPPLAAGYGKGQVIAPGQASPIGLVGTVSDLRLLSDTVSTVVWVCWIV